MYKKRKRSKWVEPPLGEYRVAVLIIITNLSRSVVKEAPVFPHKARNGMETVVAI